MMPQTLVIESNEGTFRSISEAARQNGVTVEALVERATLEYLPLLLDQDLPDEAEIRAMNQEILDREDLAWDED